MLICFKLPAESFGLPLQTLQHSLFAKSWYVKGLISPGFSACSYKCLASIINVKNSKCVLLMTFFN